MGPITSGIIDGILLLSNTNPWQETDRRVIMWDYGISILTRNYLDVNMSMTRAIAQLGRAPRLHARQCFFRGVHHAINRIDLIEKSMSYSMDSREQENNSLTNILLGPIQVPIQVPNRTHHWFDH